MFLSSAAHHLSSFLWSSSSQTRTLEDRVETRCMAWSWSYTLSEEAVELTTLFEKSLHGLDKQRKTFTKENACHYEAFIKELQLAKRFASTELQRSYSLVWPTERKRLAKMRGLQTLILLQAEALLDAFGAQDQAAGLSVTQSQDLSHFLHTACNEQLQGARSYPLNKQSLAEFEAVYRQLDSRHDDEKQAMLTAIAEYRKALGTQEAPAGRDPHAQRADCLLQELRASYERYIPTLLASHELQARFAKQVIRDQLSLEIFFKHPFVAEFLRRSESLEKSVTAVGHQLQVGKTSQVPEILIDGQLTPIHALPGYDKGFLNLGGWHSMGLDYRSKHYPLKEAIEADLRDGLATHFVYTDRGLIRFNPRTWCKQEGETTIHIDPRQDPDWWKQIPAYKTLWITAESDDDQGYRCETLTMRTQEAAQAGNIHAFSSITLPTGRRQGRQIEVKVIPTGEYAYLYEGTLGALKNMHGETHILSDQCQRNHFERHFSWYQEPLTEKQAMACLKQIGQERINSLNETYGAAPSFSLTTNNCGSSAARIARAGGQTIPLTLPFGVGMSGFSYAAASVLNWVPPLRWGFLWWAGHHTVFWDRMIDNAYTASIYLWLRRRTDAMKLGAEKLEASRPPLLPGCSWRYD